MSLRLASLLEASVAWHLEAMLQTMTPDGLCFPEGWGFVGLERGAEAGVLGLQEGLEGVLVDS